MGRQAYITRLALGRSAFEEPDSSCQPQHATPFTDETIPGSSSPESAAAEDHPVVQQYDSRGHPTSPASRARARSFIRAQNDVLASVGVCSVKISHQDTNDDDDNDSGALQQLHDATRRGNARTQRLYRMDSVLNFAATWWIVAVKHRLLAFTPLWRLPLPDMLRHQYRSCGARDFFSAGLLSSLVDFIANMQQDDALYWISRSVYSRLGFPLLSERKRRIWGRFMSAAEPMLKLGGFMVIAPFKAYGILQLLGLVSPFPLLPGPQFFRFFYSNMVFSSSAPSGDWSISSVMAWASRSPDSPLLWLLLDWYLFYPFANALIAHISRELAKEGFLDELFVDHEDEMRSIQSTPQSVQFVTGGGDSYKLHTILHNSSRSFHALRRWLMRRLRPERTWDDLCATGLDGPSRGATEHGIAALPVPESSQPSYNHGGLGASATAESDGHATTQNQQNQPSSSSRTAAATTTTTVRRHHIVSASPFPYLFARRLSMHLLDFIISPLNYLLARSITLSYLRAAETRGLELSAPLAASLRCVPFTALRGGVGLAGRSSAAYGALNFLGCMAIQETVSMGMLELMFRGYSWLTQAPPRWIRVIDERQRNAISP